MSFKKFFIGEPMPDKNDPKYKERYDREVDAGKKFAEKSGLNWLVAKVQIWANRHRKGFLILVFGIVIGCFAINLLNMLRVYHSQKSPQSTVVEKVDSALQRGRHHKNNR